jgi:hypothetical protein
LSVDDDPGAPTGIATVGARAGSRPEAGAAVIGSPQTSQ